MTGVPAVSSPAVSSDDEDAAAVIAILALLSSGTATAPQVSVSAWGNPAFALGVTDSWWAAGLPPAPRTR